MSYKLGSATIRNPQAITESSVTQYAQQKTLSGAVGRDYFGSAKRIWTLKYDIIKASDWTTINTVYQTYLSTGTAQSFEVTETNYTVSATTVHIDMNNRDFTIAGTDYLSGIELILTEA